MKDITVKELAKAIREKKEIVLLDIREDYEYNVGNIDCNCIHIPMDEVEGRVDELDKDAELYVVCRTGRRAAAMANLLEVNYGFNSIGIVKGGIEAFSQLEDSSIEVQA